MKLNENLRLLRKQNGKNQKQVAEELNIPYANYNKYETTNTIPDIYVLTMLADYFHTTVDYLIGHEVPYLINKSEFSAEQLLVLDELKHLSKEQCGRLLSYIDGLKDRR